MSVFMATMLATAVAAMGLVSDPLDLSQIYTPQYSFSLPKPMLENWLKGVGFDRTEPYSEEEKAALEEDIRGIFRNLFSQKPELNRIAVMTAGAPGAGKTTLLKQDLANSQAQGHHYAYICPDDVCLQSQTLTYLREVAASDGSPEARLAAYNKWRPASNAATHLALAHLIREGYAFYFGTTSSSPATPKFFAFLKQQDRKSV